MKKLKLNLCKIKTLAIGVAIGVSVTTLAPVFANVQEYILRKVSYPIIVNGEEYANDELPALNLNGSTYIPLRAVGDVLDAKVEWNEELRRVEIGEVIIDENLKNNLTLYQNGEVVYLRINNEGLYDNSNFIFAKKNNDTHVNISGMYILLNILENNYNITNSQNPFLKGVVSVKTNEHYTIEIKSEYSDINTEKKTYEIYNTFNPTKKYSIPTDSMINSRIFINIDDVLTFFNYPKNTFNIESNDKDDYVVLNINKL
jgi:hypothetical protein